MSRDDQAPVVSNGFDEHDVEDIFLDTPIEGVLSDGVQSLYETDIPQALEKEVNPVNTSIGAPSPIGDNEAGTVAAGESTHDVVYVDTDDSQIEPIVSSESTHDVVYIDTEDDDSKPVYRLVDTPDPIERFKNAIPLKSFRNAVLRDYKAGFTYIPLSDGTILVPRETYDRHFADCQNVKEAVQANCHHSASLLLVTENQFQALWRQLMENQFQTDEGSQSIQAHKHMSLTYLNRLLRIAHSRGATDIHLYLRSNIEARFRVDRLIRDELTMSQDRDLGEALFATIVQNLGAKSRAGNLDYSTPQSVSFGFTIQDAHDKTGVRVEIRGEKTPIEGDHDRCLQLSLRLSFSSTPPTLEELNVDLPLQRALHDTIGAATHGQVLISGPTGSGKTTLVHAALRSCWPRAKKLVTIEDPVELVTDYNPVITQTTAPKHEWGEAVESALRQDPDGIFLGEIRGFTTAEQLRDAARTGHMVVSTVHANSAAEIIQRLADMKVSRQDLADPGLIKLLVASRLAPRLCPSCKIGINQLPLDKQQQVRELNYSEETLQQLRFLNPEPGKCNVCNGGTKGVLGIVEYIRVTTDILPFIAKGDMEGMVAHLKSKGWKSINDIAEWRVKRGETDPFLLKNEVCNLWGGADTCCYHTSNGDFYQINSDGGV